MAWDNGTTANDRLIYSETVSLTDSSTANGSTIDFIPPEKDFSVFINTGQTDTNVAGCTTDLEVSWDGVTWVDKDTSFGGNCDATTILKDYVAATSGDYPYYRLTYDSAGDDSSFTIVVKVVVAQ